MKRYIYTLCVLGAWLSLLAGGARAADYLIVANPSVSASVVSKGDLKNILLGNKANWDGGGTIKLALLTEGSVHETVIQTVTSRSADQFDKYWKKMVFTGKSVAPDTFKTEAELLAFVAKTPGAVGYATAGADTNGVKVLKVE